MLERLIRALIAYLADWDYKKLNLNSVPFLLLLLFADYLILFVLVDWSYGEPCTALKIIIGCMLIAQNYCLIKTVKEE